MASDSERYDTKAVPLGCPGSVLTHTGIDEIVQSFAIGFLSLQYSTSRPCVWYTSRFCKFVLARLFICHYSKRVFGREMSYSRITVVASFFRNICLLHMKTILPSSAPSASSFHHHPTLTTSPRCPTYLV